MTGAVEVTGSGIGFLLQILVTAIDMFVTISGGAHAKATANGHAVLGLLGDGTGSQTEWAGATAQCLRKFADTCGTRLAEPISAADEIGRALSFAGSCGAEIGKASIQDSGAVGWFTSAVAGTVASAVSIVYSLVEQLVVATREIVDAVAHGFGSKSDPVYDIVAVPKQRPAATQVDTINPIAADGGLKPGFTLD